MDAIILRPLAPILAADFEVVKRIKNYFCC